MLLFSIRLLWWSAYDTVLLPSVGQKVLSSSFRARWSAYAEFFHCLRYYRILSSHWWLATLLLKRIAGGPIEYGGVGGKLIGHLNTCLTKLCYVNFVLFQAPALHSGRASPILHACCCASCPNLPLSAAEQRTG